MAKTKYKVGESVLVWKRGKQAVQGTVFKIGTGRAEGYYYIDLDSGDRLLYAGSELRSANAGEVSQAPNTPETNPEYNWWENQ